MGAPVVISHGNALKLHEEINTNREQLRGCRNFPRLSLKPVDVEKHQGATWGSDGSAAGVTLSQWSGSVSDLQPEARLNLG